MSTMRMRFLKEVLHSACLTTKLSSLNSYHLLTQLCLLYYAMPEVSSLILDGLRAVKWQNPSWSPIKLLSPLLVAKYLRVGSSTLSSMFIVKYMR